MLGSSVVGMLISPINRTLLARFGGLALVPIYDIALNASGRLRSLIEVAHKALSSEVSRLVAETGSNAVDQVRMLINKSLLPVIAVGIPLAIVVLCVNSPLQLWLGSRYVPEVATTVRIMLVANYISLFGTPSYYVLIGRGQSYEIFLAFAIQCLVNSILVITFIFASGKLSPTWAISSYALGIALSAAFLVYRQRRKVQEMLAPMRNLGIANV